MPDLIQEMHADLTKPESEFIRDFFVLRNKKVPFNVGKGKYLFYFEDEHPDLLSKLRVLENNGYIVEVTPRNTPKFRLSEEFVSCVVSCERVPR